MSELLKSGQTVKTENSAQPCQVEKFIGSGGQGEVYQAKWAGGTFALKWYYPYMATAEQRAALGKLISEHQAPSNAFLWPLEIAHAEGVPGFGYLMRLRESRFKSLLDLMRGQIDPTFCTLATVGLGLADNFHKLHADGLCYCDISFGNAFFDPETGEVLICDNDNVAANRSPPRGVLGTPDFMAPEIVRGEGRPSRQTDLFSLAILLFYIFHVSHPLVGRKILTIHSWDLAARTKLFGSEPVFIFHPTDRSNEAVDQTVDRLGEAGDNALRYWPIYPQFFRNTFVRAFTNGITDPQNGRVMEGEWRRVLSQLRDAIFFCRACGKENFYDPSTDRGSGPPSRKCWHCKNPLVLPFRIVIGKAVVMLTHQGRLFSHHLDGSGAIDFTATVAEVVRHPTAANVWGLKNCTKEKWIVTNPDGSVADVPPGRSVVLQPKGRVNFGKVEGEFLYS